ncbi:MAG: hypothetical protein A2X31_03510 [Elusimicrobia bacterium GWB2_63_22]|nr:MAG: hypothetical protein A2X31_03510 [Elusimicrobia bacterium GWB2_63_22]
MKAAARRDKYRVVLVPPLHADGLLPLAAGLLKACALRDPFLRGRVEITILEPWVGAEEAPARVAALKPDLAGFTVYGGLALTKKAAQGVKKLCGAKIIFGGPLAGSVPAGEIFSGGAVDYAVAGEGELAFVAVLRALLGRGDLAGVRGLSYAEGGRVAVNPPGESVKDLSTVPSPYLGGLFKWAGYPRIPFENSRGCRGSCLYCAITRNYREFGIRRARAELARILSDFPELRTLFLIDPDLCQNSAMPQLLRLLGGEVSRRGINVEIQMDLRNLDERRIPLLNDRAFILGVGVQSVFPETCRLINRRMDFGELRRKTGLLAAAAPRAKVVLSFIIGLPGDTYKNCLANFDWGLSVNAGLFFHRLRVYPGTPLGKAAARLGIKFQELDPYYVLSVPSLGAAGLKRACALAREVSLAANIVFADKYFGFLFRHIARGHAGEFPGVALCRRVNRLARADKGMAAAAAETDAFQDDGDWSGLDVNTFRERRAWLIGELAGLERGRERRAFAARYAGFCEARLAWERVDGATADRVLRLAAGERLRSPSLLVCGAASSDPARLSGCDFSRELLVEEKFGFFPTPPARDRFYADRPALPAAAAGALKGGHFRDIVVSQVLGALPAAGRVGLLRRLLGSAGFGAKLFIIDSGLGYPEFGPGWELTGSWMECARETLENDLRSAGWRLTRTVPLGKWSVFCAERA